MDHCHCSVRIAQKETLNSFFHNVIQCGLYYMQDIYEYKCVCLPLLVPSSVASYSASRMSMYSFLTIPLFSSPTLIGASIAITMGKSTPMGLDLIWIMAPKHAI